MRYLVKAKKFVIEHINELSWVAMMLIFMQLIYYYFAFGVAIPIYFVLIACFLVAAGHGYLGDENKFRFSLPVILWILVAIVCLLWVEGF